MTIPTPVERRAELLARSDLDALARLADEVLTSATSVDLVLPPETGTILLEVREPVAQERFHVGEALVTRAEVVVDGAPGWAMVPGDDHARALAAAVCDAASEGGHALATRVEQLCRRTAADLSVGRRDEAMALAPTRVRFDELD